MRILVRMAEMFFFFLRRYMSKVGIKDRYVTFYRCMEADTTGKQITVPYASSAASIRDSHIHHNPTIRREWWGRSPWGSAVLRELLYVTPRAVVEKNTIIWSYVRLKESLVGARSSNPCFESIIKVNDVSALVYSGLTDFLHGFRYVEIVTSDVPCIRLYLCWSGESIILACKNGFLGLRLWWNMPR